MHLQKLITHLQKLDKYQLKRFEEYVQSPYFKVPTTASLLLGYLATLHPKFEVKKFTPPQIAKKVKELSAENKQAKAGSELLKAMERFLAAERWTANERNVLIDTLWQENEMHWDTLAADNLERLYTKLEADKDKDIEYFHDMHIAATIERSGYSAKAIRNQQNDIHPVVKTLDEFYAIKKLRYHCELLSRYYALGMPYNKENIEELLTILSPYNNIAYPYAFIFISVYNIYNSNSYEESLTIYNKLKSYIAEVEKNELTQSVKESIDYLISYNLNQVNKGYIAAARETLWLVDIKIKHNFFLEQGKIMPAFYRNTVLLAILTQKEPAWIEKFINTYEGNLYGDNVNTESAFVKGLYYYYIKDYDKAMPLYQQAQVKEEPVFNISVRRWQFMCMYEKNPENVGLLIDYLNAFEQYIKRNSKALHHVKLTFSRFTSFSRKLLAVANKAEIKKLLQAQENEPHYTGKQWIIEQLEYKLLK